MALTTVSYLLSVRGAGLLKFSIANLHTSFFIALIMYGSPIKDKPVLFPIV
jgi:hypothetical protein